MTTTGPTGAKLGDHTHRKYRRLSWKQLRRRHLNGGWWPEHDGRRLFDTRTVPVTRYRYRGMVIPTPWSGETTTTAA